MATRKTIVVNGKTYQLVARAIVPEAPKKRYVCEGDITTGAPCYKPGHKFSEVGAFGKGDAKGHFQLNPNHSAREV